METILIVEDDQEMRHELASLVSHDGRKVIQAADGKAALEIINEMDIDLVLSDIRMPEMDGLELLQQARASRPETLFVMITAFASTQTAVTALRRGAYDYITKPFSIDEVRNSVDHALEKQRLFRRIDYLQAALRNRYSFENIIGKSKVMHRVFDRISMVAPVECNVLITGESGTGKEVVARAIHYQGPRAKGKFVPINCGALPENLLESELFGHVKGAFTGALYEKRGLIQEADGGTLFLDEIGDVPVSVQVRLLRVLQNREIQKVGSTNLEKVNPRVIAATHQDLAARVKDGSFREDLFYRLNVVEIELPPLRERAEDIPLLANHFLKRYAERIDKNVSKITPEVERAFRLHGWPGNVRELENAMERAVILCRGDAVTMVDLPPAVKGSTPTGVGGAGSLDEQVAQSERFYIGRALEAEDGDPQRAARNLAISPSTLYRKMKKHGIPLPKDG